MKSAETSPHQRGDGAKAPPCADVPRGVAQSQLNIDVDEWDPSRGSFLQHALAGSMAGVAEHSLMFPVDTIKTMAQARALPTSSRVLLAAETATPFGGVWQLWATHGGARLWRGVHTMFTGCVPAHGLYFTIYESAKPAFTRMLNSRMAGAGSSALSGASGSDAAVAAGAGAAVALGTMAHDVIMTPMDVCKQRLQLGHHANSVFECACDIMRKEGARAFWLSYPTTLLMNLPYALVMGATNEELRRLLRPSGDHSLASYLTAGAGAGALAAAVTNPLDVVKTRLQTQQCGIAAACEGGRIGCAARPLLYRGTLQTLGAIAAEEGLRGFARGMSARICIHAPSVAICWTTYEAMKTSLERLGFF